MYFLRITITLKCSIQLYTLLSIHSSIKVLSFALSQDTLKLLLKSSLSMRLVIPRTISHECRLHVIRPRDNVVRVDIRVNPPRRRSAIKDRAIERLHHFQR